MHLVAAVARDGAIGKEGGLPWRIAEDLRHFKAKTVGHAIIMGRKTWQSIQRALPDRTSIVVSRSALALPEGVLSASSLEAAIERARSFDPEPRVIGGGEIYRLAMPAATTLHITHLDRLVEGCDVFFPAIDPEVFQVVDRRAGESAGVEFVEYRRVVESSA